MIAGRARVFGIMTALAAAALSAACSSKPLIHEAPLTPTDDPALTEFFEALTIEYAALADTETGQSDWQDARLFDQKRSLAEARVLVPPDSVEARMLVENRFGPLELAEAQLFDAFARGGREIDGATAAKAQTFFDCWLQEAEEDFQEADIAACKTGFDAAMRALDESVDRELVVLLPSDDPSAVTVETGGQSAVLDTPYQAVAGGDGELSPVTLSEQSVGRLFADEVAAEPAAPQAFIVTFETGGVELTTDGQREFDRALLAIGERQNADVTVLGHTDRVGPSALNVRLARQRAAEIEALIRQEGIASRFLTVDSFGEADPLVPTADNVPEERNRRVEIVVR